MHYISIISSFFWGGGCFQALLGSEFKFMKTDTFIYMYICILLFEKLGNKQKNKPGFCFKNVSNVVNKNFISFSRFYKGNNSIFFKI